MKNIILYTDGACSGNPGPGGWASILRYGDSVKELSGGSKSRAPWSFIPTVSIS